MTEGGMVSWNWNCVVHFSFPSGLMDACFPLFYYSLFWGFQECFLIISYNHCSAEALDNHLTAVQRDHELRSQIEERKIRSDAAYEEAKRREKALQEEKIRQEKSKAESEVCWHLSVLSHFSDNIFILVFLVLLYTCYSCRYPLKCITELLWRLLDYGKTELLWHFLCLFCFLGLHFCTLCKHFPLNYTTHGYFQPKMLTGHAFLLVCWIGALFRVPYCCKKTFVSLVFCAFVFFCNKYPFLRQMRFVCHYF